MNKIILSCAITAFTFLFCFQNKASSDSVYIRVHFLHGSKPKKQFKKEEDRWFGGMLGGHAGIEYSPNKILNFQPKARFHIFAKPLLINSKFSIHDTISFYQILGSNEYPVKKTIVRIKISAAQKQKLDSIANAYQKKCPYDYAFFGMRCGAAAYEVLAQTGIVPRHSFRRTWRYIFYPRRLRRLLESNAIKYNYTVIKVEGSKRRKWEKD